MTKKSLARQQRDEQQKALQAQLSDNRCWDDLKGIYNQAQLLLSQHIGIARLGQDENLKRNLPDYTRAAQNIRTLGNDLKQLHEELQTIYAEHKDRSGGPTSPDDAFQVIGYYERYVAIMQKHDAVVTPTALQIIEDFTEAERRMLAQIPQVPHVVDAEIISTTPATH